MDISKLFKWEGAHILRDAQGHYIVGEDGEPLKVYIRVAGDADLDRIKRYALTESRRLRDSGEVRALVPDLSDLTVEELVSFIVLNRATEIYKQAEREVEIKYPKEIETPNLAQEETYLEEVDTYFDRLHEAVIKRTTTLAEEEKTSLRGLSKERLLLLATAAAENRMLEEYMLKAFNEGLLHYVCFVDPEFTELVFKDIAAARNAAPFLKEQLINAYNILNLRDTDLKK